MRAVFTRILVYLFIMSCIAGSLGLSPRPMDPDQPLANKLAYYGGYYLLAWGFWILVLEWLYRVIRWARRFNRQIEDNSLDGKP